MTTEVLLVGLSIGTTLINVAVAYSLLRRGSRPPQSELVSARMPAARLAEPSPAPVEYHVTRHWDGREHAVYCGTDQSARDRAWSKAKYFSRDPGDFHSFAGLPGQLKLVETFTREPEPTEEQY